VKLGEGVPPVLSRPQQEALLHVLEQVPPPLGRLLLQALQQGGKLGHLAQLYAVATGMLLHITDQLMHGKALPSGHRGLTSPGKPLPRSPASSGHGHLIRC